MKVTIQGIPEFHIAMEMRHVQMLMKMAERHYDSTCRSAALDKHVPDDPYTGSLHYIRRAVENDWSFRVSSQQLDLFRKVMEYGGSYLTDEDETARTELQKTFRIVWTRYNGLYEQWKKEFDA